jgi:hypothetical protein
MIVSLYKLYVSGEITLTIPDGSGIICISIYVRKIISGIIPGISYINLSLCLNLLIRNKRRAKKEKVSIMVSDHVSTVPNARGENNKISMNIVKILFIKRHSFEHCLRIHGN